MSRIISIKNAHKACLKTAKIGDADEVAIQLGNSAAVLLTHCDHSVNKTDCEKFWKV